MKVTKNIDTFQELWENSWSGAKDTLKDIMENNKEENIMNLLEEIFFDQTPTETRVNDFLWFERDWIYKTLGIGEEEPEAEEEEE